MKRVQEARTKKQATGKYCKPSPEIKPGRNRTKLGCGRGSVIVKGDLTVTMIPVGYKSCGSKVATDICRNRSGVEITSSFY